jgi:hypothetical protein
MAEYLGKPRVKKEDLPPLWHEHTNVVKYFTDIDKPRVIVVLSHNEFEEFEAAVLKRFGSTSFSKIQQAATEAIVRWTKLISKEGE